MTVCFDAKVVDQSLRRSLNERCGLHYLVHQTFGSTAGGRRRQESRACQDSNESKQHLLSLTKTMIRHPLQTSEDVALRSTEVWRYQKEGVERDTGLLTTEVWNACSTLYQTTAQGTVTTVDDL